VCACYQGQQPLTVGDVAVRKNTSSFRMNSRSINSGLADYSNTDKGGEEWLQSEKYQAVFFSFVNPHNTFAYMQKTNITLSSR
jgi:hypothetical protein